METVKIKGMSCQHCVMAVKKAIEEVEGVSDVEVQLDKNQASFEAKSPDKVDEVKAAIARAGYEAL